MSIYTIAKLVFLILIGLWFLNVHFAIEEILIAISAFVMAIAIVVDNRQGLR